MMLTLNKKVNKDKLHIYTLMSNYDISPHILNIQNNVITMEKFDGDLYLLWPFLDEKSRNIASSKIRILIDKMHDLDISHGDLCGKNIVYKMIGDEIIYKIIDFDRSFNISRGEKDDDVIEYMNQCFDLEKFGNTYKGYVEYDYVNWKNELNEFYPINFSSLSKHSDNINNYHGIIKKLSSELHLKIFGIYKINTNEINSNALSKLFRIVVQLPGKIYYYSGENLMQTKIDLRSKYLSTLGRNEDILFEEINILNIENDVYNKIEKDIREFISQLNITNLP